MAFKAISDNLEDSGKKAQEFLKNTSEYYKLRTFKTVTKGAISLVTFLVIGIFLLLVLLFFSIGIALWLNVLLESMFYGYFIIGGFYILVIIGIATFGKKPIEKILLIKFSDIFFDNDDDPEPDVTSQIMNNKPKPEDEDETVH